MKEDESCWETVGCAGPPCPGDRGARRTDDRPMRGRPPVREGRATRVCRTDAARRYDRQNRADRPRIGFVLSFSGLRARDGGAGERDPGPTRPGARGPGEASRSPGCVRRAEIPTPRAGRTAASHRSDRRRRRPAGSVASEPTSRIDRPRARRAFPAPIAGGRSAGLRPGTTRGREARSRGGPRDPLTRHGGRRRRRSG